MFITFLQRCTYCRYLFCFNCGSTRIAASSVLSNDCHEEDRISHQRPSEALNPWAIITPCADLRTALHPSVDPSQVYIPSPAVPQAHRPWVHTEMRARGQCWTGSGTWLWATEWIYTGLALNGERCFIQDERCQGTKSAEGLRGIKH